MFVRTVTCTQLKNATKSINYVQNFSCQRALHSKMYNPRTNLSSITSKKRSQFSSHSVLSVRQFTLDSNSLRDSTVNIQEVDLTDALKNVSLPDIPSPLFEDSTAVDIITNSPEIHNVGLGGWLFPGPIQEVLCFLHESFDMPWWAAICATTLVVRTLFIPFSIKITKNAAEMQNVLPKYQQLQHDYYKAVKSNDQLEATRLKYVLMDYGSKNKIYSSILLPFVQTPVFLLFFFGIRGMVAAPVESMKEGGLFWFKDLTIPDPYYVIPFVECLTLSMLLEKTIISDTNMPPPVKWLLRIAPFVLMPFIVKFEAGLTLYWFTTNLFTFGQAVILKRPEMKKRFNIPSIDPNVAKNRTELMSKQMNSIKEKWEELERLRKQVREAKAMHKMKNRKP